ncbi:UNVERIFIED_CONTAM: hypothetical protein GTU68_008796 [Idotea baltica]|nr:hypothetical protein [Idotea baltica]
MGYGTNQVIKVESDKNGRMRAESLRQAIQKVRREGREPFFVNATCGTTVLGAFDPIEELAQLCEEEGLWLHVDACWGGSVILSNKHKQSLKGIERVNSIAWNPHKMICAPLQCSVFLVKEKGLLSSSNRVGASYLFQQDKFYDMNYDLGDKSVQCGRKADVLKLWVMFKVHGLDLLGKRVDNAYEAARHLEKELKKREGFRLVLEERDCTNVCFWYIPPSLRGCSETEEWWKKIHKVAPIIKGRMLEAGSLMTGYQPLESKKLVNFFRMVTTGFPLSTKEHMEFVADEIERLGKDL